MEWDAVACIILIAHWSGIPRLLLYLLTILIKSSISTQTRIKWAAGAVTRIFHILCTLYRLARLLLFLSRDFVGRKLTMISLRLRRMNRMMMMVRKEEEEDDDDESSSKWSKQLPEDVMRLILQRLCTSDYIRCRAICLPWRDTVHRALAAEVKLCHPAPQLIPWLMLSSHPLSYKQSCFFSPSDRKIYKSLSINPYINRRDCVGSIEGWLIMIDSAVWRPEGFIKPWPFCSQHQIAYFFLNPMSGARVMLPSASTLPCLCINRPSFRLFKMVASSVPTTQHCFVASLCGARGHVAFCRPTDKSWTLIQGEARDLYFFDIEILDGKLYAATSEASNFLMVFHIQSDATGPPSYTTQRLVVLDPRPPRSMFLQTRRNQEGVVFQTNHDTFSLAKDSTSNELFMIFRRANFAYKEDPLIPWNVIVGGNYVIPPKVQGFQVFKLEWNKDGPRWIEVVDLGDRILFVSKISNTFISATNNIFGRNCIYFAYHHPCLASLSMGQELGTFSLTNKSVIHFTFPEDHSRTHLHTRCVWFTPSLQ